MYLVRENLFNDKKPAGHSLVCFIISKKNYAIAITEYKNHKVHAKKSIKLRYDFRTKKLRVKR